MSMTGTYKVCAGWLPDNPVIGECTITAARGRETTAFEYSPEWLKAHPDFTLGPDVMQEEGKQYPPQGHETFGFLSDVSPDRWGRRLMDRKGRADQADGSRLPGGQQGKLPDRMQGSTQGKLAESDYMLGVSDEGRMGGIRLQNPVTGAFESDRSGPAAMPSARLRELADAAGHMENSATGPERSRLELLLGPGSSLGGARPKANITGTDGSLWIAKFPSGRDTCNVSAWEMTAHELAKMCGINVPPARLETVSGYGDVFLVRRFDRLYRDGEVYRRHYASAMAMLGETDGTEHRYSYLDLVDVLERLGGGRGSDRYGQRTADRLNRPESGEDRRGGIRELWRRLIFNICIRNADDHLRNHAFMLLPGDIWDMTPAYDLNPAPDQNRLSLLVNLDTDECSIEAAMEGAEYFGLSREAAEESVYFIRNTVKENWRPLAGRFGISRQEQARFSYAFAEAYAKGSRIS